MELFTEIRIIYIIIIDQVKSIINYLTIYIGVKVSDKKIEASEPEVSLNDIGTTT